MTSQKEQTMTESIHPNSRRKTPIRALALTLALMPMMGSAACSSDVEDVLAFVEYIEATGDVLDANGFEAEFEIDCEGSTDTNEVTCTGTTTEGLSIESSGEDLGEDTATLVVTVGGEVLYDGLLDDADDE